MRSGEDIDALIGDAYEAALDATLWPSFGRRLAQGFHANSALIQVQEPAGATLVVAEGAAADYCSPAYKKFYWQRDVWVHKGMELGFGHIITSRDMGSAADFAATEFYTDVCRKLDVFHIIGVAVPLERGGAGTVSVHRPLRSGHFDDSEVAVFARLVPHLARALRIRMRLEGLQAAVAGHTDLRSPCAEERLAASAARLRSVFGLTAAEARITVALAEGLAPADIARFSSRSLHTVRSQLKQIFDKTKTTRQAQLVALLHRIASAA